MAVRTLAQRRAQVRNDAIFRLKGMAKQLYRFDLPRDATIKTAQLEARTAIDNLINELIETNTADWENIQDVPRWVEKGGGFKKGGVAESESESKGE